MILAALIVSALLSGHLKVAGHQRRTCIGAIWHPLKDIATAVGSMHLGQGAFHSSLQGECSKEDCKYLHKELQANVGVCRAYAAGFCGKGSACTQKHLTPRMLRELRASRTLRAADGKVGFLQSKYEEV